MVYRGHSRYHVHVFIISDVTDDKGQCDVTDPLPASSTRFNIMHIGFVLDLLTRKQTFFCNYQSKYLFMYQISVVINLRTDNTEVTLKCILVQCFCVHSRVHTSDIKWLDLILSRCYQFNSWTDSWRSHVHLIISQLVSFGYFYSSVLVFCMFVWN